MPKPTFESVDAYLASFPDDTQAILRQVRAAIRKALPKADESISYQIPTYKVGGRRVVYFAGWKKHYSVYPVSNAVLAKFGKELAAYEVEKGTIRFPLSGGVPVKLISGIAKLLLAEAKQP